MAKFAALGALAGGGGFLSGLSTVVGIGSSLMGMFQKQPSAPDYTPPAAIPPLPEDSNVTLEAQQQMNAQTARGRDVRRRAAMATKSPTDISGGGTRQSSLLGQ